jgi:transcription elongation factor/antiterminator RfaH
MDRLGSESAMDSVSHRMPEVMDVTLGDSRLMNDFPQAGSGYAARPEISRLPLSAPSPLRLTSGDRWYVVYAQPNREFRAQIQLAAQGFHTFLPRYRKTVCHARKLMAVSAPFFQRYLFVALDLSRDRWRSVNGTFGVTSLVTDGTFPRPVPHGVVESLVKVSDANGFMNLGDALQLGERVRLLTGPFADLVGELVRIDGTRRVRVLLQLLGGVVAVSIDRGDLVSARAA